MHPPSANTQAVLLLTSPLLQAGGASKAPVLSPEEYAQLAARLLQSQHQPADLINGVRDTLLTSLPASFSPDRLHQLLSRGFQLSQAVEHWAKRSIQVIGRADPSYPRRYKQRLKRSAPPLLYACGNLDLLSAPALAVVGSRDTPESLLQKAERIGALAAGAGIIIASGAAKGVDQAAMLGCLTAGGGAIGVVADSLEKISVRPIWRQALMEGRLLLLSSEVPSARFQVWRAMARNKLIYALADSALVVSSAKDEGGTWKGATEQLQKLRFAPLHVLDDPRGGPGLAALQKLGARPWPNPETPEGLSSVIAGEMPAASRDDHGLAEPSPATTEPPRQGTLLVEVMPPSSPNTAAPVQPAAGMTAPVDAQEESPLADTSPVGMPPVLSPAAELAACVDDLVLRCLDSPLGEDELAALLEFSKTEVRKSCKRLLSQGKLHKRTRPVKYVRHSDQP